MKRKVVYDHKLVTSIAYVTQNWDAVCKERYINFCMPHWNKRGIGKSMCDKVNSYSEPVTLCLHALDRKNLQLTLEFLIVNEENTEDRIMEFEVEDGM